MALRALMIRKKLDEKKKNLEALRAKDADFEKREAELETAIDEAETDEEKAAVEEEVEKFENEKAEHENAKADLEKEVGELENELTETEKENEPEPQPEPEDRGKDHKFETREVVRMNARARKLFGKLEGNALNEMMQRDDVKGWIGSVRESIANKRAVTNAGLTIPEVFLGLLRENIMDYSKLYKHVNVQPVSGTGRQAIMGTVPEGIWTECCATLNELNIAFSDVEVRLSVSHLIRLPFTDATQTRLSRCLRVS